MKNRFGFEKIMASLLIMPLNLIVPLVITSFAFGFPYPYFKVNGSLKTFASVFEQIPMPEETSKIGSTENRVGNLIDNVKKAEEESKQKEESKDSDTPSGEFNQTETEEDSDAEEILNQCDLFSGMVIKTSKKNEELSKFYLEKFSETVDTLRKTESYGLSIDATISVVPLNKDSLILDLHNFRLDILKNFKIKEGDLDFEKDSIYLVYMLNDNVLEDKDPRCK